MIQHHGDFYEQIWLVHSAKFLLEFLAHSAFMPSWIKSYVIGTKLLTGFFVLKIQNTIALLKIINEITQDKIPRYFLKQ